MNTIQRMRREGNGWPVSVLNFLPMKKGTGKNILRIFSTFLISSFGLTAPDIARAESNACESDITPQCLSNDEKIKNSPEAGPRVNLVGASALLYSPASSGSDVLINGNNRTVLSLTENTESSWAQFKGLNVGRDTFGEFVLDNRTIETVTGSIGNNSSGSVLLTNNATWTLKGGNLVLGTNNGNGLLLVEKGSTISGINEFRIGEFYAGARGEVTIEGKQSSVSTGWVVVGDQGKGRLNLLNGGQLAVSRHMNVGYVGNTAATSRNGEGNVLIDGEESRLNVTQGLYLGGFSTAKNDARGVLTVSNGGTARVGTFLWLATGKGSTGIVNIGSSRGEMPTLAGYIETPWIYLGDTTQHDNTAVLNFNHVSEDYALTADITGRGEVSHNGTGKSLLSGNNTYYGPTTLNSGTFQAGGSNAFSRNSDFIVADAGTLDLGGYSQTVKSLSHAGTISFGTPGVGQETLGYARNTLTVTGDYQGKGGLLILNTAEDVDLKSSLVNKLYVKGDTSGTTRVVLKELGNVEVSHLDGARVVQVDGASKGEFIADSRLVAGAHEYSLKRGTSTSESFAGSIPDSNHWYLTNKTRLPHIPPGELIVIPDDETPGDPDDDIILPEDSNQVLPPAPSGDADPGGISILRPEAAGYLANKMAGNTVFNSRFYERLGASEFIDPISGEARTTSLWMRHIGGHTRFSDNSGQLKTQSNRYVIQLGGDIAEWSTEANGRWHTGIMAGYANVQSNSRSDITRYRADAILSGYSAGLYATWLADADFHNDTYLDSWVLYNWFDNTVHGEQLEQEKYHSQGITASVEAGHAFKLAEEFRVSYWMQPQVQLTWMGVSAHSFRETNGTVIKDERKGNLQSRIGLKSFLRGHSKHDDNTERLFQPFIETNWLHNTRNYAVSLNGYQAEVKGTRNAGEVKVGVESKITNKLHLWGSVGQQTGNDGFSDTQALFGVKIVF